MDFNVTFPAQLSLHLRSMRKARGWSQAQLAARVGVAQSRISAVEKDATKLTAEQLFRWLAALNAGVLLRMEDAQPHTVSEPAAILGYDSTPAGGQW